MSKVFISYDRDSQPLVITLANDIKALDYPVWFDQELTGGHSWWDEILENIRECDIFVFALAPRSVESAACKFELAYAQALGKSILPILVTDGVKDSLLPIAIAKIQHIDFRNPEDKQTFAKLHKALKSTPPSSPLPDPLPASPELPVSYMSSLSERTNVESLSDEEQTALLADIREKYLDPEHNAEAKALLRRLLDQHELSNEVETEIKELLGIATVKDLLSKKSGYKLNLTTSLTYTFVFMLITGVGYLATLDDLELHYLLLPFRSMEPEMVLIPSGQFNGHEVKEFNMSKYEITFVQYDMFLKDTKPEEYKNPDSDEADDQGWGRGDRPVINLSWEDATAYAEWLSRETGKSYRLPTEFEWEYAARAGTKTNYWWGDDINQDDKVWANCSSCGSEFDLIQTAPVGSFVDNKFHLYDTQGNVWEWVQDCYEVDGPVAGGAPETENCARRVLRGGGWSSNPELLRSANRIGDVPGGRIIINGFRLAQDL